MGSTGGKADGPYGGSIINVSSTGSVRPAPPMLPHDAAMAGLNTLTEGFATDASSYTTEAILRVDGGIP